MIKVLVVDDSLFMRRLVSDLLASDPEITVIDTAKSGDEALRKIPKLKPDVITLDLVMPGTDGLETLKKIMSVHPIPVVIISAYSREAADITLKCLHAGAVGFVVKPSGELSLDIDKIKEQLISEVKSAAGVDKKRLRRFLQGRKKIPPLTLPSPARGEGGRIIIIGASTGGPQTLELVLSSLPPHFPVPIVVVQHMPDRIFTQSLARRLDEKCPLPVREAGQGEKIKAGNVYIIPAGTSAEVNTKIHLINLINVHSSSDPSPSDPSPSDPSPSSPSPSIDITMKSAAGHYREAAIGVILTGVGSDGLEGMRAIRSQGGRTIAQNESALVFGMPQKIIEEGLADLVLPAEKIGKQLVEMV